MRKIKKMRLERGFTQRYIAYKTGVSQQAVVKWESGETMPAYSRLKTLAKIYDCTVDELLDWLK